MKIMKKLMALALASALALTLLTGCGGGGGGGGAISDGNGGTITISGTQNANTEFSKAFINAQASTGINMSYEAAKGAKAQKFMEVVIDSAKKNPNQKLDEQFVLKIYQYSYLLYLSSCCQRLNQNRPLPADSISWQ